MANIAIADNNGLKFAKDIMDHWIAKGHEVRYERGASEHLAQWADLYYVDWADHNIHYLYGLYHDDPGRNRTADWDNNKKPVFVCRALDIDIWTGSARDQSLVDWVDKWICIAPHLEKKLRAEATYKEGQLQLIRPGVNLEKFTLKTKKTDGFQVGMVLGDMWWAKNHMAGLDIFASLYQGDHKWKLHIRGQHEPGEYWPVMYDHYLDSRGIREAVTLYPPQDDMNAWYENIDILLHPGMKEGFAYCIAESLSKDIKVVANEFYGSLDIWPNELLYQIHGDAIKKILEPKKDKGYYRKIVQDKYSLNNMLKEFDNLLCLE